MNKLSLIKIIKSHIKVEGDESSFLHIMGDCLVGSSSVRRRWSTFLKNESKFDCVRCSTLISLLKAFVVAYPTVFDSILKVTCTVIYYFSTEFF